MNRENGPSHQDKSDISMAREKTWHHAARMPVEPAARYPWDRLPGYLPESLWRGTRRSRELTPLMVQRYRGRGGKATATWHDDWELAIVFSGHGLLHAETTVPLRPSSAWLVPPRMYHHEEITQAIDILWVGLSGTWLEVLPSRLVHMASSGGLLPLARQLWLCAERRPAPVGVEMDGLVRCLVGHALRSAGEDSVGDRLSLDDSIEYMHRHHDRDLSVVELARRCGCTERHFNRVFRQQTGLAPLRYLRRIRIENSQKLMAYSQLSLAEIAQMVGYADAAYFSRVFRNETGISPSLAIEGIRSHHSA